MVWFRTTSHDIPPDYYRLIHTDPSASWYRFKEFTTFLSDRFLEVYPENLRKNVLTSVRHRLLEMEAYLRYVHAATRFRIVDLLSDDFASLELIYQTLERLVKTFHDLDQLHDDIKRHTLWDIVEHKRKPKLTTKDELMEKRSLLAATFATHLHHIQHETTKLTQHLHAYTVFQNNYNSLTLLSTTTRQQLIHEGLLL